MAEPKKLQVTGGPHGKNMRILLDDKEVENAYRLDVQSSWSDAVRIQIGYVMLEMADLEIEGTVTHVLHLKTRNLEADEMDAIEQRGDSLVDCLRKLADRLEAEAGPVH